MNDEKLLVEMQDYNTKDKVRLIAFRTFNSKVFLVISILLTISFIQSIIGIFTSEFKFSNLLYPIMPFFLMKGVWKTYIMAKKERVIDTSGLKTIRSVMTIAHVLLVILTFLLLLAGLIEGLDILVLAIVVGIVALAYYIFGKTLTNFIYAFEEGDAYTDYYIATVIFLIIGSIILIVAGILIMVFTFNWVPRATYEMLENIGYSSKETIYAIFSLGVNLSLLSLIAYLVYRFKNNLSKVFVYYPKDNVNVKNIDYKISSKILESDKEIDDRIKYN